MLHRLPNARLAPRETAAAMVNPWTLFLLPWPMFPGRLFIIHWTFKKPSWWERFFQNYVNHFVEGGPGDEKHVSIFQRAVDVDHLSAQFCCG